jgi:hypothetical protein
MATAAATSTPAIHISKVLVDPNTARAISFIDRGDLALAETRLALGEKDGPAWGCYGGAG